MSREGQQGEPDLETCLRDIDTPGRWRPIMEAGRSLGLEPRWLADRVAGWKKLGTDMHMRSPLTGCGSVAVREVQRPRVSHTDGHIFRLWAGGDSRKRKLASFENAIE